jgi:RNA polymerase sigma-70 factor (ECF subfamily)
VEDQALAEETDADLVARCRATHPEPSVAFDALYTRHAGPVLSFLYGIHRHDEHAARDALQETFLRCWSALPSYDPQRPLRPWLLTIARNVAFDQRKKASFKAEKGVEPDALGGMALGTHTPPPDAAARKEVAGILRRAVLALPDDQRAVFLLKHEHGLTYAQAAEALGCSVRTAKYRMKAALETLGREAERLGVEA